MSEVKYFAAYCLSEIVGNTDDRKASMEKILRSVGANIDAAKLNQIYQELSQQPIEELIQKGMSKIQQLGGQSAASSSGSAQQAQKEENKEEKKDEEEEVDMGAGGLFGDDF